MKPKSIVSVLLYFSSVCFTFFLLAGIVFLVSSIINLNDKSKSGFQDYGLHLNSYISIYENGITKINYSYSGDSTIRYIPVIKEYAVEAKPNTPLAYYHVFFKLIFLCFCITFSWFSFKFFKEIKLEKPFNFRFIKYLKIIALLFISFDILKFINTLIFNYFILKSELYPRFYFNLLTDIGISNGILLGMVIWIIAIIFQRGVELQTENDLTV